MPDMEAWEDLHQIHDFMFKIETAMYSNKDSTAWKMLSLLEPHMWSCGSRFTED